MAGHASVLDGVLGIYHFANYLIRFERSQARRRKREPEDTARKDKYRYSLLHDGVSSINERLLAYKLKGWATPPARDKSARLKAESSFR
jgi:hypothetical protein